MKTIQILEGLSFASHGRFSDPISFSNAVLSNFPELNSVNIHNKSSLLTAIDNITQIEFKPPYNQKTAMRYLLAQDLLSVKKVLEDIDEFWLTEAFIKDCTSNLISIANEMNLSTGEVELRLVDKFPKPYQNQTFAAMTYDIGDKRMFNITPGVALLKSHLRPLYSTSLLAHEFVHTIIGQIDTDILARGFEEGLADYIGSQVFSPRLIGKDYSNQIIWNSRNRYGRNQLGRLYRDSFIQVLGLSEIIGSYGIIDLLKLANRKGRSEVKKAEEYLLKGEYHRINVNKSTPSINEQIFCRKFLSMTTNLVVSPLAMILAQNIKLQDDIKKVVQKNCVSIKEGDKALQELQDRVFLVLLYENKIVCDETKFYINLNHLRYEV